MPPSDPAGTAPSLRSRRAAILHGASALALLGMGACASRPEPPPRAAGPSPMDTPIGRVILGSEDLAIAGEPLDVPTLRRFYARRNYAPAWIGRQREADSIVDAVLRASDHGMDPEMFHAALLRRRDSFPSLRRDLLLTDAFLRFGNALAHGAMPPDRRKRTEALAPGDVDVAEVLAYARDSTDPAATIETLAPATPSYAALKRALHEPPPRDRRRAMTAAAAAQRRRSIEANLERQRWLPRSLPPDRVWVNVADQQLVLYIDDQPEFATRVIVGDNADRNQSPEFQAVIEAAFFNPPWVIPRDIVEAELLPRIAREPDYLERNNMVMRANGEVEQLPGPTAGLGFLLFDMPNRFDVFLHDTPDRFAFGRSNRRLSRGCIRVQNPRELAALLMRKSIEEIDETIAQGRTTRRTLPQPMPVFITYHTAFAGSDGKVELRPDFYERDADVVRRLRKVVAT